MDKNGNFEGPDSNCSQQVQVCNISTYKIAVNDDELLIRMLGKRKFSTTSNLPQSIAGTIKIDNTHIPVIDPQGKKEQETQKITDDSCVVMTTQLKDDVVFSTAKLYPDFKKVLELILEHTD